MSGDHLRVLVVDDDPGIRDLYSQLLGEAPTVETAADGRRALDLLVPETDVVFLDRHLPGPSGLEIADTIAASAHDPYVTIVSSKRPDVDEAAVPIDQYLQKPVGREPLLGVLETVRARRRYRDALDELFAVAAELAAIEADSTAEELGSNDRYQKLRRRVEVAKGEVNAALDRCTADWAAAFETVSTDVSRGDGTGETTCCPEAVRDGRGWEAI